MKNDYWPVTIRIGLVVAGVVGFVGVIGWSVQAINDSDNRAMVEMVQAGVPAPVARCVVSGASPASCAGIRADPPPFDPALGTRP